MTGQSYFSQSHISVIKMIKFCFKLLCLVCDQKAADALVSLPLHTN